jgi:hypothetical protein
MFYNLSALCQCYINIIVLCWYISTVPWEPILVYRVLIGFQKAIVQVTEFLFGLHPCHFFIHDKSSICVMQHRPNALLYSLQPGFVDLETIMSNMHIESAGLLEIRFRIDRFSHQQIPKGFHSQSYVIAKTIVSLISQMTTVSLSYRQMYS